MESIARSQPLYVCRPATLATGSFEVRGRDLYLRFGYLGVGYMGAGV